MMALIIDLDAHPFVPRFWWLVAEHRKCGQFEWDASKISLYLSKNQQNGRWVEGNKLYEEVKSRPVLNANLLGCLLKNPHLIPEGWKRKAVFFWGTLYLRGEGELGVCFLDWTGAKWHFGYRWLGDVWREDNPAAVRTA